MAFEFNPFTGSLDSVGLSQASADARYVLKVAGAFTGLTGAGFRDTSAAFDVTLGFTSSTALTAARGLTFDVVNASRTVKLSGNVDIGGNLTTTGSGTLALGGFTLTVPATGTAALLGTANVFTAAQTINAGTLTTAALTLTQTWNNAGVVCRGLEYAVTDTNSAAGSTLLRLLGGAAGTTQLFSIDKSGWLGGPTGATMVIAPVSGQNLALYAVGGGNVVFYSQLALAENGHLVCGTTSGNKFGTATSQKLGFWNATPVVQPAHIADPSGGAIIDAEARTAINSILAWQATLGLTAAA